MPIYSWLLLAYPRSFRERFGAGMRHAFECDRLAARADGSFAYLAFWLVAIVDAVRFGLLERLRPASNRRLDDRGRPRLLSRFTVDWRDASRSLRATPMITALAVLSLALGIGSNTALFSILNSLVLKPLPVRHAERLVLLDGDVWTNPIWEEIRSRQQQIAESAFAWSSERFDLSPGGESDLVDGVYASGGIFEDLGVTAVRGRMFTPADDVRGGPHDGAVAVISYGFWQRRFGGADDVVGRKLTIDRTPFTIIGVAPRGFFGPEVGRSADLWLPLAAEAIVRGTASALDSRATWWLNIMLRLRRGQTIEQAASQLHAVQAQIRSATIPAEFGTGTPYLQDPLTLTPAVSGYSPLRSRYEQPLTALLVVVALVLFIACANIASLLMARAVTRRHELSIRLALGAPRLRLARQLLAESMMLAGSGAALGLVFANWGSRALVAQLATSREAVYLDLAFDWRVIGFTVAAALATAVLFGVAPALGVTRLAPNEVLKEQAATLRGDRRVGLRQVLVVLQVALSLMLVVTASMFTRTLLALTNRDPGFDRNGVLVASVHVKGEPDERLANFERLREAAAAIPGVSAAAASFTVPIGRAGWNTRVVVPPGSTLGARERMTWVNAVSPGWFRTYGIRMAAGRDFTSADRRGSVRVAVVNRTFVRRFLKNGGPIGERISEQGPSGQGDTFEIVGIVEDAVYRSLRSAMEPTLYLPVAQWDRPGETIEIGIRPAGGAPLALTRSVAAALERVDPDAALTFSSLAERVNGSFNQERILAGLSSFFGALALLLAGLGLYGVTAHNVNRRRTEIGIRMALGAEAASLVRLVLVRVASLVAIGIAIGTGVSLVAARSIASLIYGFAPWDPVTFAGAAAVIILVALAAGWLPARRASRLNPTILLREG